MSSKTLPFILGLLLLLPSCAYFIEKIDAPLVKDSYRKEAPTVPTYCPLEPHREFQLIGSNKDVQNSYYRMLQKLPAKYDAIDQLVLWSMVQLYARPDQSSPTSRLQVLLNHQGKTYYFDFFSENTADQFPYLYGLDWILKKFGKKTTLETYSAILTANLSKKLPVGKDLASFLATNISAIKKDPILTTHYIRGSEILREGETIPPFELKEPLRVFRQHQKEQKIIVNTALTPYNTSRGQLAECNYDFNLYDNSIFLIDKVIPSSNLFGLILGNSSFLASSSQKISKITSFMGLPIFHGESKVRSSALCIIEKEDMKIWAYSNQSRDPGQHLFHLIRYGLSKSRNVKEVDRLLKHSRHLFLSDPVRLIIESNRSRPDQIENLLKLNLPIYNADQLGNIWAYTSFKGRANFLIDDRNNGYFLCK